MIKFVRENLWVMYLTGAIGACGLSIVDEPFKFFAITVPCAILVELRK